MDKRENTITIKIDGKNQPFNEQKKVTKKNRQTFNQKSNIAKKKTSKDNSHSLDKDQRLKGASLNSNLGETAAARESMEEEFDWILPEQTDKIEEFTHETTKVEDVRKKGEKGKINWGFVRNGKQRWLIPVFLAVFFAILLGTSFGFFIMKLIITDQTVEEVAKVEETKTINQVEGDAKQFDGDKASVPAFTAYVVQGGVFSSIESAKQIETKLVKKELPVRIVEMNNQAILFISVADSLEHAKEIAAKLAEKDSIDVFAKPFEIDSKKVKGVQKKDKEVLEKNILPLYNTLVGGATNVSMSHAVSQSIKDHIQKQLSTLKKMNIGHENLIKMKEELEKAFTLLNSFNQIPTRKQVAELQNHLLNFVIIYESFNGE
ncbi:hypothetical protein H1Z61_08625 [Bacillus aquiflavi]|uniref:SPOR domain-containing protein n=1 Tax=Bacillus aquiflavi TaxID=2672567 RepID=A0A6B3W0H7_9BACI|nr:hypothetical protein [Bacillus aquiflavi]MBA4537205.1 hypothetical protein [Bacillus aquiflavi]NEY81463.1 hypothetical protein [Bacillus aquiflavi]